MPHIGIMCGIIACFMGKSYEYEAHTLSVAFSLLFYDLLVFFAFNLLFLNF